MFRQWILRIDISVWKIINTVLFTKPLRITAECCCANCLTPSRQDHSADLRKYLHWLPPVRGRVDYKIAVLCYKAVKLQQPSCLTCLLLPYRQSHVLRSSTLDLLSTQSSSTNIAARRFSCCVPIVWNSLPSFVCTADSFTSFRSQLKTYMFARHL